MVENNILNLSVEGLREDDWENSLNALLFSLVVERGGDFSENVCIFLENELNERRYENGMRRLWLS
jgi:hypothetical protein